MHYVVFSKCGGCLDTSILEIAVSLLAAFHMCWFSTHLPHRRSDYKNSSELVYAAHVGPCQTTLIPPVSQHRAWPTCLDGGDMKHTCHSCPQCSAGARVCVVLSPDNHLYLPAEDLALSCFYALHTPQVTKVQEHRCRQNLRVFYAPVQLRWREG